MRSTALAACALLGCGLLSGCFFSTSVPQDVQLSCSRDESCPAGYVCQESIALCVLKASLDTTPPELVGGPTLDPLVGTVGQIFRLAFTVNEPLFQLPVVSLDVGGREAPFASATEAQGGPRYLYTYTADGSEAQGPRQIHIGLVDEVGTESHPSGGLLTLDFVAPRVTAASLGDEVVAAHTQVTLTLSLSEAPDGQPEVVMSRGAATLTWTHVSASDDGLEHSYTYATTGDESEGLYQIRSSARDLAGNRSSPEDVAALTLDFTAPTLTDQLISPGALVRPGAILTLAFELSEPLPEPPVLTGWPRNASGTTLTFAAEQPGESRLLYTHTVRASEDGDYELSLEALVDAAGNSTAAQLVGTVRVDGSAPELVGFTQSATSLNAADTLVVQFEASEPLAVPPVVELQGHAFTRDESSGDAPYRYSLDLTGTDLLGSFYISVTVVDEALNAATHRPGVVTVDARPPGVIDALFTPAAARLGVTALLTITTDEPLLEPAGVPALALTWALPAGDPGFRFLVRSGLAYTFVLLVDDSIAAQRYGVVSVDLVDEANNPAHIDLATVPSAPVTLDVDNRPPVLSALGTDRWVYSAQPGFDQITLSLDVNENLDVAPASLDVTLGTRAFACGSYQEGSPSYTCTRPVDDAVDAPGGALIRVIATDAAGNQSFDSTSIELDFQAPRVVAGSEGVQLIPAASTPLTQVSRVTLGTTVRLSFAADEPLARDPQVSSPGTPPLAFTRTGGAGTFFIYQHLLEDPAVTDGVRQVHVVLDDAVGNSATWSLTLPAPGFEVDRTPPPPLTQVQDDALRYRRDPWGSSATEGQPDYRVEQTLPGALPGGATVVFWDRAATTSALELGRGHVDGGGTMPAVELNRSDRARIFASLVDEAGNIDGDTARQLHHVEWLATLHGKVAGSTIENPHRAEERPWLGGLLQAGATEAIPAPLQRPDDSFVVTVRSAELRWRRLPLAEPPTSSTHHMVYDATRGLMVLYDGTSGETWEFRDRAWSRAQVLDREGDGDPEPGGEYIMAFDQRRGVAVLVDTAAVESGSWEYNGQSWRRAVLSDTEGDGVPGRRRWSCLGWDGVNGEVILYGGETTFSHNQNLWTSNNELWTFDGERWLQRDPSASPAPAPAFRNCAMAWDPHRRRVVLLGRETWEWDGAVLHQKSVGDLSFPPQAWEHQLAYDSTRRRAVAHGGMDTYWSGLRDTWEYDGQLGTWSKVFTGDVSCTGHPCYRSGHGVAYDPVSRRTVLFGGSDKNDTWEWDGATWTVQPRVDPEGDGGPTPAIYASLGYDSDRQRVLIVNRSGPTYGIADWWLHDGASWSQPTVEDNFGDGDPGWRLGGSLSYDDAPGRQSFVFFGGYGECPTQTTCADTWTFDGVEWQRRCDGIPAGDVCDAGDGLPGARRHPASAFDSSRKETYLYGGTAGAQGQQLWRWDHVQWHLELPTTTVRPPNDLSGSALTYDEGRDTLVMFGGFSGSTRAAPHVWEWSMTSRAWTEIVPTDPEADGSPETAWMQALAYDRDRHAVVLHEHRWKLPPPVLSSWEWNGQSWRHLRTASPLSGEWPTVTDENGSLLSVHDREAGRTFLMGDHLWELLWAEDVQPALTLHFDFAAAGAPPGTRIEELKLSAVAGATSLVGATATDGGVIASWDGDRWQPRASFGFGPQTPGAISWSSSVASETDALWVDDSLHLAIVPEGVNGDQDAVVVVDHVELRVRYRLP
ncbi:MAG: hypothetical protein ABIJ09_24435 [Pseudomonadota bacterium]